MAAKTKTPAKAAPAAPAPASADGGPANAAQPPPGAAAPGPEKDAAMTMAGLAQRFAKRRETPAATPAEPRLPAAAQPETGKPADAAGAANPQEPEGGNPPAEEGAQTLEGQAATPATENADGDPAAEANAEATPPENPPPEPEPATPEAAPEPTDENPTADLKLPAEVQQKVNARIAKVVGERNQAREQLQAAQRQQADLRDALEATAQARNPAATLDKPEALEQMGNQMRELRRWCKRNADGGTLKNEKGEATEYSAEEVARMNEHAEDWLEQHLPRQARFLARRTEFDRQTDELFPELRDPKHALRAEMEGVLAAIPELRNYPHARWIATMGALGMQVYQQRQAAKKNGNGEAGRRGNGDGKPSTPAPAPARIATRAAAAPPPETRRPEVIQAAHADQTFQAEGTVDALANRFAAKRMARQAPS